jgi:hypothetical protein
MSRVLIATPTAGGVVKALYATTLVRAVLALTQQGLGVDFLTVDGSYVSKARNYFAQVLLRNSQITHLIMIDSDMAVDGQVIRRLLDSNKPVVAAAYSQRRINMEAFAKAARGSELSVADLTALALAYNVQPSVLSGTRQLQVTGGMCRVEQVALGCSAIRRDAFETLIEAGLVRLRPDRFLQASCDEGPVYGFFDEITLENGDILSEDYSFCRRWKSVPGSEIWAIVDETVGHIGDMVYGAPYVSRLLQGKA